MNELISELELQNEINDLFNADNKLDNDDHCDKSIKKTKLILSGGGVKGVAHLGGLKALQELGMLQYIDSYIGSSVGAMISVMLSIGYSPEELFKFISILDINKMKSISFTNLLGLFGLDDGKRIELVFDKMFSAKNISPLITFKQLFEKTGKTVIIAVACLNDKKAYYYSHTNVPDMKVLLAVRMSTSIPIYFAPVRYNGKLFIDGGCIDNYPIQLFNNCLDEVIGLYLTDVRDNIDDITNIEDLLLHIIQCLFEGVTCNSLKGKGYEKHSVKISLSKISLVDFNIDKQTKQKLYDTGYDAVMKKFK